jgi:hypothetical protein
VEIDSKVQKNYNKLFERYDEFRYKIKFALIPPMGWNS